MKIRPRINLPWTLLFVAVFGLSTAGSAYAGWWHKTPEQKAEKLIKKITGELDLSAEQNAVLKKGVADVLAKMKSLKPQKNLLNSLVIEQIKLGRIDKDKVKQAMGKHKEGFEIAMNLALERADDFLQTLNEGQRQKLAGLVGKMKVHPHCPF